MNWLRIGTSCALMISMSMMLRTWAKAQECIVKKHLYQYWKWDGGLKKGEQVCTEPPSAVVQTQLQAADTQASGCSKGGLLPWVTEIQNASQA